MKITDQGGADIHGIQSFTDDGYSGSSFFTVDSNANQFGTSICQLRNLLYGIVDIGRIGVGHGLHDDGCITADLYIADLYRAGCMA